MNLETTYLHQRAFPNDIGARQEFVSIVRSLLQDRSLAPLVIADKHMDESLLEALFNEYINFTSTDELFRLAIREKLNFLMGYLIQRCGIIPILHEFSQNTNLNELPYVLREYFQQLFREDKRARALSLPEAYQQGYLNLVDYLTDVFETYGNEELIDRINELTDAEIKIPNSNINTILRRITGFLFPYTDLLSNRTTREDIERLIDDHVPSYMISQLLFGNRRSEKVQGLIDLLQNKQFKDVVYSVMDAYSDNRFLSDIESLAI